MTPSVCAPGAYVVPGDGVGHAETIIVKKQDVTICLEDCIKIKDAKDKRNFVATLRIFNSMLKRGRSSICTMTQVAQTFCKHLQTLAAIVHSAASIQVFDPSVAAAYELQGSESSTAGDEYEIANGDLFPRLDRSSLLCLLSRRRCKGKNQSARMWPNHCRAFGHWARRGTLRAATWALTETNI